MKEIKNYLIKQGLSDKIARELSEFSGGIPGIALSYGNNLDSWSIKKEDLGKMLSVLDKPINARLKWVEEELKKSKKSSNQYIYFEALLNSYLRLIRDVIVFQINTDIELIHPFLQEFIIKISQKYKSQNLLKFYNNALEGKKFLNQNVSPKTILENLLLI